MLPAIVLLLAVARANRDATVEPLILQSITSTFGIRAEYVNIRSGKHAINEANQ